MKESHEEGTAKIYISRKEPEWSTDDEGFRSRKMESGLYSRLGVLHDCKCTALDSPLDRTLTDNRIRKVTDWRQT